MFRKLASKWLDERVKSLWLTFVSGDFRSILPLTSQCGPTRQWQHIYVGWIVEN
ncbi:hypothetical protein M595_1778 [Lyngbya aestuarii BL J]|uniref:Uncharacterized protein n=1 Tax=Lyngbya aestuarii BL J TaxID=1348334 RepID=U7QPJ5_9CYAN|nr:hypothetical protein M595_1778 [Lyngbya aestuarii BL J]